MKWQRSIMLLAPFVVIGCGCRANLSGPEIGSGPNNLHSADSAGTPPYPATQPPLGPSKLRVGDPLLIRLSDLPTDPSWSKVLDVIKEDGTFTLLDHPFKASGKTVAELETEIHDYCVPKHFSKATVMIYFTTPPMYLVRGEVKSPCVKWLLRPTTVRQAIEIAGGFTEHANRKKVQVNRIAYGKSSEQQRFATTNNVKMKLTTKGATYTLDLSDSQKGPKPDMNVLRDDYIIVPR